MPPASRPHSPMPRATYRLQLHAGFMMNDARDLVALLGSLGVSHLYLSPILSSTPGSTHGYDGINPRRIDPERGGTAGFEALRRACIDAGLGMVLDIVPNHLATDPKHNPWWLSLLRLGERSPWARVFDLDLDAPGSERRIVLPVLGAPVDDALLSRQIRLSRDQGAIRLSYFDHAWPVRPDTVDAVLREAASRASDPESGPLADLAERFNQLEHRCPDDPGEGADTERSALDAESALGKLLDGSRAISKAVDDALESMSEPNTLRELLAHQHYLPMDWRDGLDRVNYRRFFHISDLAAVRVEDPWVYDRTHALVHELTELDGVDGLRVDHPDGLRDPREYFQRLARNCPGCWIVAEKILHERESLREDWDISGTTGYDFLNDALGVLIDARGSEPLTELYDELVGGARAFRDIELIARTHAATDLLRADLARLTRHACAALALHDEQYVAQALSSIAAHTGVYRTYTVPERGEVAHTDAELIRAAADRAARDIPDPVRSMIARVAGVLLDPGSAPGNRSDAIELGARFQQYTAPVAAKGVEDTALYRETRLTALNEVGGDPVRFGLGVAEFHRRNAERASRWPGSMLSTGTHDTKRSEDVRARLAVLPEIADRWSDSARRWFAATDTLGFADVDPVDRYGLLQTLVGAWPIERSRVSRYAIKAAREAGTHTTWTSTNDQYESRTLALVDAAYENRELLAEIEAIDDLIRIPGRIKGLAMAALKFTSPGVPDIYQGCELWDRSLVDPDNRRPVDFDLRRELLDRLASMSPGDVWSTLHERNDPGVSKLWVTRTGLGLRARHSDALGAGSGYRAIDVRGEHEALGLARTDRGDRPLVVAVVPLRTVGRPPNGSIDLPRPSEGIWKNLATGQEVRAGSIALDELFGDAPLALLEPAREES